jgi:septal ring factor EnvC (AmiA/AmiB activator)
MNRAFIKHLSLCLVLSTGLGLIVSSPNAEAKRKYTITNRINALNSKINAGQKSNELTLKEADSLRGDISDINDKIAKDKSKNGGKLSYADENKIEKKLNSVSEKLQKKELAKRAARPND